MGFVGFGNSYPRKAKDHRIFQQGFTLVELIVVLVILAILAAMLVPALTGYIRRARQEKEFQAASTVYAAAQALATEAYGHPKTDGSPDYGTYMKLAELEDLTGLDLNSVTYKINTATTGAGAYAISGITVSFDGTNYYHYNGTNWTADTTAGSEGSSFS